MTWLRDELEDRKITQKELAKRLGVFPAVISNVANGKQRMSLDFAIKLANEFGYSLDFVCGQMGYIEKPKANNTLRLPEGLPASNRVLLANLAKSLVS